MADLLARLRGLHVLDEVSSDNGLGREAADEIERLRLQLAEAERLVRPVRACKRPSVQQIVQWQREADVFLAAVRGP